MLFAALRGSSPARRGTRLACERLEDRAVPATVVADFPGFGLYRLNAGTNAWQQLDGLDPTALAVDAPTGDLTATFHGYGTYEWTPTQGWTLLTGADASVLSVANDFNSAMNEQFVAGEFGGAGVWLFHTGQGWSQLTAANATSLTVDGSGNVVGAFANAGIWQYTPALNNWRQITSANASQVAFAGAGNVVAELPGHGVWDYTVSNDAWAQLTPVDAVSLAAGGGSIAASFNGYGTFRFDLAGNAWTSLTASVATRLDTNGADVVAVFQGYGTWNYDVATGHWAQINGFPANLIGVGA